MAHQQPGVQWREWTTETFEEAQAQDKPILLDIGAVWCHWCHVMDEGIAGDPYHTGTYTHPEVQRLIEEHFIPIKVDNDKRPDINARYNMGGWPTTAFLTPQGETLYGETYVPPDRMIGLLSYIVNYYHNEKEGIAAKTGEVQARRAQLDAQWANEAPGVLEPNTTLQVTAAIKRSFDPAYGGFGKEPKFPHPAALALCVQEYALTGDAELKKIAEKTMTGMDSGGMYDRFAGGFFRYSTTQDWSIPHFEKMLEDNARLTATYALASSVFGNARLLETVHSAHAWLLSEMYDKVTGCFAGSQDADAEEAYYGQTLAVRATLPTPYIDRTIYANWNSLMVSALAARYRVERSDEILAIAVKTFAFLRDHLTDPASDPNEITLYHYWVDGTAQGTLGLLADQADFAAAALDLYEITSDPTFLEAATHAANYIFAKLQDPSQGGFFDLATGPDAIGELARPKKDIIENSAAALVLLRLTSFTDIEKYRHSAEQALKGFIREYRHYSYSSAPYALAVEAALHPSIHIVIVGNRDDERLESLQGMAWNTIAPGKVVETLDAASDAAEQRGYPAAPDGGPRAYVCIGTQCLAPVTTPDALKAQIEQARLTS